MVPNSVLNITFGERVEAVRTLLSRLANLPTPLARTIDNIFGVASASDMLSMLVEHYKLVNQFLFLSMLAAANHCSCGCPHEVQVEIKKKWLRAKKRDMTEGEKSRCAVLIRDHIRQTFPKEPVVTRLLDAIPRSGR